MRRCSCWMLGAGTVLLIGVPSSLHAQAASELRVGVGQHVRLTTHAGETVDGFVREWANGRITIRQHTPDGDTVVALTKLDIDRAEVAVSQPNSIRNAAIGGAIGLAAGSLFGRALAQGRSCSDVAPRLCELPIPPALLSMIGFTTGLIAGWHQRPATWMPVTP